MLPEGIERRGDPAVHPVNGNRHLGCPDIAGQRLVGGQYSQGVCRRFQFIQQGFDNGGVFSLQRRITWRVGSGMKEIVTVGVAGQGFPRHSPQCPAGMHLAYEHSETPDIHLGVASVTGQELLRRTVTAVAAYGFEHRFPSAVAHSEVDDFHTDVSAVDRHHHILGFQVEMAHTF